MGNFFSKMNQITVKFVDGERVLRDPIAEYLFGTQMYPILISLYRQARKTRNDEVVIKIARYKRHGALYNKYASVNLKPEHLDNLIKIFTTMRDELDRYYKQGGEGNDEGKGEEVKRIGKEKEKENDEA